jgi:hypothetical protein
VVPQNHLEVSQKVKLELPHDPAISLLGTHPKVCKSAYNRDTCTPMCIAALFTIPNDGINVGAHQLMNGYRKCGKYTQWSIIQS